MHGLLSELPAHTPPKLIRTPYYCQSQGWAQTPGPWLH